MNVKTDFWSRRKAAVEAEAKELENETEVSVVEDERPDEEVLGEMQLAAPETLETSEDVKEFLKHDLPQRLKARGLRQLWRTNPVLANLDGLVDYGEDFTDAAVVLDKMESVYQVGKGMLTAFVEEASEDAEENHDDLRAPEGEEAEEPTPLIAAAVPQDLPTPESAPTAMPQRRMRFEFESAG